MLKIRNRKNQRALAKAIVAEQCGDDTVIVLDSKPENVTFRIVLTTQVYENYGAHCWDGEGECPQYWKAKGGNEYQRNIGSANDVIQMGSKGVQKIADEMSAKVTQSDEGHREHTIGWSIVPSNKETYEEADLREMCEWGIINGESYERQLAVLHRGI